MLHIQNQLHQKDVEQPSNSNNQLSISRLAEEIQEQQRNNQQLKNKDLVLVSKLNHQGEVACWEQQYKPPVQKRQQSFFNQNEPKIKINYSSNLPFQSYSNFNIPSQQKDNHTLDIRQLSVNQMSASRIMMQRQRPERLKSIQQNENEYKRSDQEAPESQASFLESRIVNKFMIQNIDNFKKQTTQSQAEKKIEKPILSTTKKSNSAQQSLHLQNDVVFRPIQDSIELNMNNQEELELLQERNTLPNILQSQLPSSSYRPPQGLTSRSSQATRVNKVGTIHVSGPISLNRVEGISQNQLHPHKQMLQKIQSLAIIIQELSSKKMSQRSMGVENEKVNGLCLRQKIQNQLREIKMRLSQLQKQQNSKKSRVLNFETNKLVNDNKNKIKKNTSGGEQAFLQQNMRKERVKETESFSREIINNVSLANRYTIQDLESIFNLKIWQKLRGLESLGLSQRKTLLSEILLILGFELNYKILCSNFQLIAEIVSHQLILILSTKSCYIGQYQYNNNHFSRQGFGLLIEPLKQIFAGEFKSNHRYGHGIVFYRNGSSYQGYWYNDRYRGQGIFKSEMGDTYLGQFQNNEKEGFGVEQFANGDKYEGIYRNNVWDGQGIYTWKNTSRYEGQFVSGRMEGLGEWISYKGDTYCGEYRNNLKQGWGVYKWKNGKIFQGYFHNGKRMNPEKRIVKQQMLYSKPALIHQQRQRKRVKSMSKIQFLERQTCGITFGGKKNRQRMNSTQKFRIFFN